MTFEIDGQHLELDYPCEWEYKVIGLKEQRIIDAAAEILGDRAYDLQPSHVSRNGRYHSMALKLTVADENDRNEIYYALKHHLDIFMVL